MEKSNLTAAAMQTELIERGKTEEIIALITSSTPITEEAELALVRRNRPEEIRMFHLKGRKLSPKAREALCEIMLETSLNNEKKPKL